MKRPMKNGPAPCPWPESGQAATAAMQSVNPPGQALAQSFFDGDARTVAKKLLGKALCHLVDGVWLAAVIVETEAYYRREKASHASLGFTEKRRALFMPPGTIYMYYARGGDSFNVSCRGKGNAVLVKAGIPYLEAGHGEWMLERMTRMNPLPSGQMRAPERLCAGQTLLCRALGLRVPEWDARTFDTARLQVRDVGRAPVRIVQTTRLGIPEGRDHHLPYRFVDLRHVRSSSKNPLARGGALPSHARMLKPTRR